MNPRTEFKVVLDAISHRKAQYRDLARKAEEDRFLAKAGMYDEISKAYQDCEGMLQRIEGAFVEWEAIEERCTDDGK